MTTAIVPNSASTSNPFSKATKAKARLRMAIYGASGSGKTYSALAIAQSFGKIALIDTERGSASKYAGIFNFDTVELDNPHPNTYMIAINQAAQYGYDVLIIDSLSHAWQKVLELVDNINKASKSQNSFTAWRDVTPLQNQFIDTMLTAPIHIIATMRSKTEYVMEKDERTGKNTPRKVGLAPIQRDGVEYEFDIVGEMNQENDLVIVKTRCPELNGVSVNKPNGNIGDVLKAWLSDGVEMPVIERKQPQQEPRPASVSGAGIQRSSQLVETGLIGVLNSALSEKLVKSKTQFDGIVFQLKADGVITDGAPDADILEAIRVYQAAQDLKKEGA